MKHLSSREFTDAIDGRLDEAGRSHLDACAECAGRMALLKAAVSRVEHAGEVPEPSPLFWDHFSARVRDAVRDTVPDARPVWRHPAWAIACSIVLVAGVILGVRDARVRQTVHTPAVAADVSADAPNPDDAAWNLLTNVASSVEQDDPHAAPLAVRPSEIDRAVNTLSAPEREELSRLLQDEMKRAGD